MELEVAGETEVPGENLPLYHFSITNLTCCNLRSNPDRRDGEPATVRLSYSTASSLWCDFQSIINHDLQEAV
jgi:hypothetical protein